MIPGDRGIHRQSGKIQGCGQEVCKGCCGLPVFRGLEDIGDKFLVAPINAAGGYPTRNFLEGTFEGADQVSGEYMQQVIAKRGGKPTHMGCSNCVIHCSKVYVDEKAAIYHGFL